MTRIDSGQISRLLTSLSRPSAAAGTDAGTALKSQDSGRNGKATRDTTILRSRLKARLSKLEKDGKLQEAATLVTVQEILRWEFGDSILEHANFDRVAQRIASDISSSQKLERAISKVIEQLLSGS